MLNALIFDADEMAKTTRLCDKNYVMLILKPRDFVSKSTRLRYLNYVSCVC